MIVFRSIRSHWLGILALAGTLAWPSSSLADGIAVSQAILDWSGFTYTITGNVVVTQIDGPLGEFSLSSAHTVGGGTPAVGGSSIDGKSVDLFPQTWPDTSAFSGYTTATGNAVAQGSTVDGYLISTSQAATATLGGSNNTAESGADTSVAFLLYGTGVGSFTITIPYSLSTACNASDRVETTANASVTLIMGPGLGDAGITSDSLSCQDNQGIKQGDLTLSRDFTNPVLGPGVLIEAFAQTSADAHVPEASTVLLVTCGLVGLAAIKNKWVLRAQCAWSFRKQAG